MIDIIIPAYNAEDKIYKALSSLSIQTEQNFTVYIIDDGSEDNIQNTIAKFNTYLNINYLKCEHLGKPGLVRNYGIDHSNGEYIMFCDSDDFFAPNAVEIITKTFNEFTDIDFIVSYFYEQLHTGEIKQKTQSASTWLHGNAYKREFLNKYNIRFPDQKLNEDGAFNTQVYLLSDKFKIINIPIYYWVYNDASLTRELHDGVNKEFEFNSFIDLIDSLNFAYKHLFELKGYDDKILGNMGSHIAMFHSKLCSLVHYYSINSKKYKKLYDNSIKSLNNFFSGMDINKIFNNAEFKKNFCSQYLKYKKPNVILNLDSYFSIFGVKNYIKVEDFCNLI